MKFKLPVFKLKWAKKPRKKLRATAVRGSVRAAVADYDDMAEPNMKLSRALLIVLILHVVAVSGIIAFNAIKTRQGGTVAAAPSAHAVAPSPTKTLASPAPVLAATPEVRRARAVGKSADDTHKTYVVQKGESPVTIAKKLKVSYDDLLALNHIDDPRKLKIGQKLLVPNKSTKGKKGDE